MCISRQQGGGSRSGDGWNADRSPGRETMIASELQKPPASRQDVGTTKVLKEEMKLHNRHIPDRELRELDSGDQAYVSEDPSRESKETNKADVEIDAISPLDEKSLPIRAVPTERVEGTKPTVLLVEDNDINLQILIAYMRKEGYEYATARNGLEAFETYRSHPGKFTTVLMGMATSNVIS
jgi:PleD family two-component response regulator